MAALLRQGARRIGGSVLQRTQAGSPAVAEERRRQLVRPRRMCSTEESAAEEASAKRKERLQRFKRIDSEFTDGLKAVAGLYMVYVILTYDPRKMEERALRKMEEKQEE